MCENDRIFLFLVFYALRDGARGTGAGRSERVASPRYMLHVRRTISARKKIRFWFRNVTLYGNGNNRPAPFSLYVIVDEPITPSIVRNDHSAAVEKVPKGALISFAHGAPAR